MRSANASGSPPTLLTPSPSASSARQGWLTRLPLWMEIGIALALKVALLYLIHQSFFAHPEAPHMKMALPKVEQHFISATDPNEASHGNH